MSDYDLDKAKDAVDGASRRFVYLMVICAFLMGALVGGAIGYGSDLVTTCPEVTRFINSDGPDVVCGNKGCAYQDDLDHGASREFPVNGKY